jgi:hypothetical protein
MAEICIRISDRPGNPPRRRRALPRRRSPAASQGPLGGGTKSASVWRWARNLARCARSSFDRVYFSRRSGAFWDSSPQLPFRAGSRRCSMTLLLWIRSRMQSQVRLSLRVQSLRASSLPAAPLLSIPCRRSAASDRALPIRTRSCARTYPRLPDNVTPAAPTDLRCAHRKVPSCPRRQLARLRAGNSVCERDSIRPIRTQISMALEVLEHLCGLGSPREESREHFRWDLVEGQCMTLSIQCLNDFAEAHEITDEG